MSEFSVQDEQWMRYALRLAERAREEGEVPVGAVIVDGDEMLGEGWNCPIRENDPSAHAEMVALRQAAKRLSNYRLPKSTTLYVTLEPCCMCAGALIHARIGRVVFGASDPKAGAAGSVFEILGTLKLNHFVKVEHGLLAEECSAILKQFFQSKRSQQ